MTTIFIAEWLRENTDIYFSLDSDSAESRVYNKLDDSEGRTRNNDVDLQVPDKGQNSGGVQRWLVPKKNIYRRPNARKAERNYIHTIVSTKWYRTTKEWMEGKYAVNGVFALKAATRL